MSNTHHILMTRTSTGVKTLNTFEPKELSELKETLKVFLEDHLDITNVKYSFLESTSSDVIAYMTILRTNDDLPTIIHGCNINDSYNRQKERIKECRNKISIGFDDFNKADIGILINSLIASGDLSHNESVLSKKGLTYETMPQILLAGIKCDSSKISAESPINTLSSNDALLVCIGAEEPKEHNQSLFSKSSTDKALQLLKTHNGEVYSTEGELLGSKYNKPNGDIPYIYSQYDYDYEDDNNERTLTDNVSNETYIENSLILSDEFTAAFNDMTGRSFGFFAQNAATIADENTVMTAYGIDGRIGETTNNESSSILGTSLIGGNSTLKELLIVMNKDNADEEVSQYKESFNNAVSYYFFGLSRKPHYANWSVDKVLTKNLDSVNIMKDDMKTILVGNYQGRIYAGRPIMSVNIPEKSSDLHGVQVLLCVKRKNDSNNVYTLLVANTDKDVNEITEVYIGESSALMFNCLINVVNKKHSIDFSNNNRMAIKDIMSLSGLTGIDIISAEELLA